MGLLGNYGSLVVIALQPGSESVGPVLIVREDPSVGPLDLEGAIEPLHFPVLPGLTGQSSLAMMRQDVLGGRYFFLRT